VVEIQLVLAQGRFRESPREAVGVKQAPKLSPVIVTVPLAVRPTFQGQADENAGAEKRKWRTLTSTRREMQTLNTTGIIHAYHQM
jgi:hypothetical protein